VLNDRDLHEGSAGGDRNKAEVRQALLEITARASANAETPVGVGLSVLVGGEVQSIGATTSSAERMDAGQVLDGTGPCLHALTSGDSVWVTDYATDVRWPGSVGRAAETGVRSSLSLPLKTRQGVVLGALNVYSSAVDAFSVASATSLGAFAEQATASLFWLGKMQEQRDDSAYVSAFSRTVQQSLRTVLPEVSGLELVGGSVPWTSGAMVSGDWYDALLLPDESVGLVIGDVMGHDIAAVTAMAQLRTMVRSGAWLGHPPDEVLAMTDELAQLAGITETATLFFGKIVYLAGTAHLEYCNAGHLHPLLRQPDGSVTVLDGGSRMLLGALGTGDTDADTDTNAVTARVELAAGSVLLLYTDGLVERPGVSLDGAVEQLVQTLTGFDPVTSLADLCQQLLGEAAARDDTTVFAVRIR
jgi:hypothetical protein